MIEAINPAHPILTQLHFSSQFEGAHIMFIMKPGITRKTYFETDEEAEEVFRRLVRENGLFEIVGEDKRGEEQVPGHARETLLTESKAVAKKLRKIGDTKYSQALATVIEQGGPQMVASIKAGNPSWWEALLNQE